MERSFTKWAITTLCLAALAVAWACDDSDGKKGGGADTEADSGADSDADSGADSDAHSETDSGADSDADSGADSDADSGADSDAHSGADSDGDTDAACDDLLCPEIGCALAGDPCNPPAADTAIFATYRKDRFLPITDYNEPNPDPLTGGRIQIAGIAAASGAVTKVQINGQDVAVLEGTSNGTPQMEWHHVWPDPAVAGEPIWVAFHSRSASWDGAASGQVTVTTTSGTALDGQFEVAQTDVPLTYVTVSDDGGTLLIHVKNNSAAARTVERLLVNGRDALAAGTVCVPSTTLAPSEAALWTVPLCAPAQPGDAWTVVVDIQGQPASVGVGRILRPHFPIESWPKGSDCPFPGGNEDNLDIHLQAGFDTLYMYWGTNCQGTTGASVVNDLAPAMGGAFHALIGDDFFWHHMDNPDAADLITDFSAVAGFLTGDESDGEVYNDDGTPRAADKAARARWIWSIFPQATVYNGAMTNRNVGTFAGMCDVQGIDFYVAGCAPHITNFFQQPPLRGAYDYLRNTRDNHMPGTTWFYAQGLHDGSWTGQPSASEIIVQAFSVMAAGGKGLMWFQSPIDLITSNQASWNAISGSNWAFRGLRHLLREGDIAGLATASGNAIVDGIRSREAIVVPVIGIEHVSAPTPALCGLASIGGPTPHFVLADQTRAVTVDVPADMGVADVFEVVVSGATAVVQDPGYAYSVSGRQVTFPAVPLSEAVPVRVLVLAANPDVRSTVEAAIQ
jgi:hypothetical protein